MDMKSEEMQKLKKENYREYRKKYLNQKMKSYDWYCDICKNGKNYTLRNKFTHLKTKKHERNYYETHPLIEL